MFKKIHLIISGKVQGVFYRVNAKRKAEELGLKGWIKNTSDGKVEIVAEGNEDGLKEMIEWCYNGSSGAVVDEVEAKWMECEKKFDKFEIIV
jgi:acylphosphatase